MNLMHDYESQYSDQGGTMKRNAVVLVFLTLIFCATASPLTLAGEVTPTGQNLFLSMVRLHSRQDGKVAVRIEIDLKFSKAFKFVRARLIFFSEKNSAKDNKLSAYTVKLKNNVICLVVKANLFIPEHQEVCLIFRKIKPDEPLKNLEPVSIRAFGQNGEELRAEFADGQNPHTIPLSDLR
jgi:hypothetical protein